jgi:hypothetical protein
MHVGRNTWPRAIGLWLTALAAASIMGCADVRGPGVRVASLSESPHGVDASPAHHHDESEHDGETIVPVGHVGSAQTSTAAGAAAPATQAGSQVGTRAAPSLETQPFRAPIPTLGPDAPASRYAELSDRDCQRELEKRALPFERAKATAGVATPLYLTGPLHGVRITLPGKASPHGVIDCRLALALDDFASALSSHGVTKLRVDNSYRPGARLPGKKKQSQHAHAMALDITELELSGGRKLTVKDHWTDPIGATPCGPEATPAETSDDSLTLRNIICDVARRGLFHHMLTPSFNAAHRDHFHFDLRRGTKTQSVR